MLNLFISNAFSKSTTLTQNMVKFQRSSLNILQYSKFHFIWISSTQCIVIKAIMKKINNELIQENTNFVWLDKVFTYIHDNMGSNIFYKSLYNTTFIINSENIKLMYQSTIYHTFFFSLYLYKPYTTCKHVSMIITLSSSSRLN